MKFHGELLILILLLLTNLRVFFVNHSRRDSLTALAPLCFCFSILQLLAQGIDVFTVFTLIVSLLVFLSNFHAIFRYSEHLYVDRYSPLMKGWAVFTSIIIIITIAATIFFAPVEFQNKNIGVKKTITRYKGGFRNGFEPASFIDFANGFFYEYKKAPELGKEPEEPKEIILLIPDKRGDTQMYEPYLQLLAKENYTACSANFYSDDLRWLHSFADRKNWRRFFSVLQSISNNQKYISQREFYTYNTSLECKTLLQLIDEKYGKDSRFFLISDTMGYTAIKDFAEANPSRVKGIMNLASVAEYKTAGYGLIEQTDPLLAFYLGYSRDADFTVPELLSNKTISLIDETNKNNFSTLPEDNNDTDTIEQLSE